MLISGYKLELLAIVCKAMNDDQTYFKYRIMLIVLTMLYCKAKCFLVRVSQ